MKYVRRGIMLVLFFTALLTTFQSISGVEAKDLSLWLYQEKLEKKVSEVSYHSLRRFGFHKKTLIKSLPANKQISSEEIVVQHDINKAINWDRYPSTTVVATGYTAGVESTGKSEDHPEYGITYSGVRVKRDLYSTIAADLDVFPIGTILFIPGYGYGVVADKGGAIKGNEIDLYYETVKDVYSKWGKKKVEVFVVKRGDGTITEEEINSMNENQSMQVFREQIFKG